MPEYEAGDFEPPAPIARGRVIGPDAVRQSDVRLLVDTGADVSVLPLHAVEVVGAAREPNRTAIEWYDGTTRHYEETELTLEFLTYRFRGRFLVGEAPYGILGRNILNLLVVTLDGPRQYWTA